MAKRLYWDRYVGPDSRWRTDWATGGPALPPGEELAALRGGLGRPAMDSAKIWPFYTSPVDDVLALQDRISDEQEAEHAALALFGLHQQSQVAPMHRNGVKVGQALLALRRSGKFSEDAVDRRVSTMAGATSVPALLMHLRGLITQLRAVQQPLDYSHLMADIRSWHDVERRPAVRRRWALGYQAWRQEQPGEKART
ncbi:type I-E CRISPR-associated protein Cse2/CasB [Kitasatospora acidiphila]|uniref:type I-E CRISPR-associated protein Cse2/CasB n=1 Tax=Kitasatospora acidiphila TaxID=2567942 RepID=UPI001E351183|nr:type I-E CRISPR-associated protein Cse2/CasB [Kitasatospora acidiphila]